MMPFPVTHSLLSTTALRSFVDSAYRMAPIQGIKLLSSGLNDTYHLSNKDHQLILRVYRAGWRSEADIRAELEATLHLNRKRQPISYPIMADDGEFLQELHAPEGTRYAVLFTHAPGQPPAEMDRATCALFGRSLAGLHDALDDFHTEHRRLQLDLEHLINQPLQFIQPLLQHRSRNWEYLTSLAQRLRSRLTTPANQPQDWGFCHGDATPDNAHLADGKLTWFDFDCAGMGWRAYDLGTFYWSLHDFGRRVVPDCAHLWDAFLYGYTQHRSISPPDRDSIPVYVAIRHLWMIGLHAQLAPRFGYERFNQAYFNAVLQFFRDWEQGYLS